ncbi:undecaprenyl/decaprenyl-phosphate alpha-N-acetylglucosaminyl 1-phosphate transferase [Sphingobacterium sp. DK4209]|uniref:Undecaprenyl/decaprenyl-phosphate alpha-N-acetylglucosaminyl 1-phosphate transferase n=1 Tax=Sphingobacterium zhuxiongii TaxID=2662364 RepID=A0A5Q0QGK6_9SPHI|nr:undecaprenyl/decaprenyl-phosphate alpha-N-acetylglucosaminyl 1-phosphate transferase [Sphingobacterium sp. DK4209]QGA28211.1 undecaprenyl/decaprenyl-phosphate alpha-N-acetylglucosaminyl 1-phosphate transferase [Sphingobacterium sp. dk4302]
MKLLVVFIPFIIAIMINRAFIPFIMLVTYKKRLFDPIDERKIHRRIIPRLGGVSFAPVQCLLLVITMTLVFKANLVNIDVQSWAFLSHFMMLVCGLVILSMVGIGDDLIGVNYKWKFVTQILVASLLPLSGLWINDLYGLGFIVKIPFWIGMPLTVFVIVLIINAINLIDGLDGLCSGLVGVSCLVLGSLFVFYGAWVHALFAFITLGVLIPFFYYNVFGTKKRRRQIFMGDTGSMTLGFSVAFLAISLAMNNQYIKPFSEGALVVAFSTLIIPVFDVARVMLVRWRLGNPIFKPDRNHLHHKFLRAGMTHRTAMISIIGLALFFSIFNIVLVEYVNNNAVFILDIVMWVVFHLIFNRLEKRKVIERVQLYINLL